MYYQHHIGKFDIAHEERDLLALYNFARNVLMVYAPKLLKRLQKAVAALSILSTLSFSAGTMSLEDDSQHGSQQPSQGRDAEGFATPVLPARTQTLFDEQKDQMDKLLQQLKQQRKESEQQRKESEQQREDAKQREERLMAQLEQQRKESQQQLEQLMQLLSQQGDQLKQLLGHRTAGPGGQ